MKIGIDVSQMCYEGTGVARYVRGLTESLLSLDSPHTFVLFAGALQHRSFFTKLKSHSPWNHATWSILPLPPKLAGFALNALPVPFEWLLGNVDIIHTSDWSQPMSHLPLVTTVHDLVFKKYPETVDPLIRQTQESRLTRVITEKIQIIADSQSTKNDLMEIYKVKSELITVIYPGLDYRYTPQSSKEIERVKIKYQLPQRFVLSVGTQEPRKNIERLIEATRDLDMPLILIGKYGWGAKTQSLGFIPDADLPGLYSGATVFAYPSLYEGFGFPVLESMACGVPVVTSNTSSLPEVGGDAAVLVDPLSVEAIRAGIIAADLERVVRIKRGLAHAKKFTWELAAKQVMEVYEKTAHRH